MRLIQFEYNSESEYRGSFIADEAKVAAQILSFQCAKQFLRRYSGKWELEAGEIRIYLNGIDSALCFELETGMMTYGSSRVSIVDRYTPAKGLECLTGEFIQELSLPIPKSVGIVDPIFELLVKLIEIYHARCGLEFMAVKKDNKTVGWEIFLKEGPHGVIYKEGILENRSGERTDIAKWLSLRPEKLATYVYRFNHAKIN